MKEPATNFESKMKVNILAFGIAREIFGSSTIQVEIKKETAVSDLKILLEEMFPRLKQLSSLRIAVNSQFSSGDEVIEANDEIAVIPPVSGG